MGNCLFKASFITFYLSFMLALTCLGVCTTFLYIIGGPPPTQEYDIGSKIFFFSNISQITFLLIALLLCKHRVTDKCAFFFCEFGLLASLSASLFVIYSFQNLPFDSQKIKEYSNNYLKLNDNRPPPYLDFMQNHFFCCGLSSFSDYDLKINGSDLSDKITVPQSCCKVLTKETFTTPKKSVQSQRHGQGQSKGQISVCSRTNLDHFPLIIEHDLQEKIMMNLLEKEKSGSLHLTLTDGYGSLKKKPGVRSWMKEISTDPQFVDGYRRQFMSPDLDLDNEEDSTLNSKKSNSKSLDNSSDVDFRLQAKLKMGPIFASSIRRKSEMDLRRTMTEISRKWTKCEMDEYVDKAIANLAEEEFNRTFELIKTTSQSQNQNLNDLKVSNVEKKLVSSTKININLLGCLNILEEYASVHPGNGDGVLLFFFISSKSVGRLVDYMGGHFHSWGWKEEDFDGIDWSMIVSYALMVIAGLNLLVLLQFNIVYLVNCWSRRKRESNGEFGFLESPE